MDLIERFITSQERIATALEKLLTGAALAIPPETSAAPAAEAPKAPTRTRASAAKPEPTTPPPVAAKGIDPVKLPAQPLVPIEELRASIIGLANHSAAGKAEMMNILSSFSVKKATDLPPERWGEIKAKVDAAMAILTDAENFT